MRTAWKAITGWFEHGDLVPLIIIVSAVHYSSILQEYDHPVVASSIGFLVDLGHYRTVRAAVRYHSPPNGRRRKRRAFSEREKRWAMAIFMTCVSAVYQWRFYNDPWFALPLPLLVLSLAWLQQKDSRLGSRSAAAQRTQSRGPANPKPRPSEPKAIFTCSRCGNEYQSQQALNGHMRAHKSNEKEQ